MRKLISAGFVAVLTASVAVVVPASADPLGDYQSGDTVKIECVTGHSNVAAVSGSADFCLEPDNEEETVLTLTPGVSRPCAVLNEFNRHGNEYTSAVTVSGEIFTPDCVEEPRDPAEYLGNTEQVEYNNYEQPKADGKARVNTDCKIVGAKLQKRNIVLTTKGACDKNVSVGTRTFVGMNTFTQLATAGKSTQFPVSANTSISIVTGEPTKKHPNGDRAYILKKGKKLTVYREAGSAMVALFSWTGVPTLSIENSTAEQWLEPGEEEAGLMKFLTESTISSFVNPVHDRYQG